MGNENYKVCESCGRKLPESMFSKSYKNRCKECVAEQTRQRRATKRTIQGEQTVHPGMMPVQETKELAKTLFTQIIANGESIKKDAIPQLSNVCIGMAATFTAQWNMFLDDITKGGGDGNK